MKVVVLGSWGIGESVLRSALATPGCEVAGVFTRSADPAISDEWQAAVWNLAVSRGLRLFEPGDAKGKRGCEIIASLAPDVVLSAAHPFLLSREFLAIPRCGVLNLHGSLLPKNRGTSPVNWALIRDERESGLTMHFVDEGMDSGDIVYQEIEPITDDDLPGTLADRIKARAEPMVRRALTRLISGGELPRTAQDPSRATLAPRLKPADLQIDWNQPARRVWSLIRGLSQPGLGARTAFETSEIVIWNSRESGALASQPGHITAVTDNSILVSCSDACLQIPLDAVGVSPSAKLEQGRSFRFGGR